ncbi:DMT family transporter [Leeia aquatica]|uniref:DMT family transporter n=1 Tax=Leeia aquatica TaxID=2725557 RepID=A0A847SFX9_9NEIS|nr:DMT family transporter [Leeia aquatica]NLR74852.1 DMT family transporter [Leeia aquatica]
MPNRHTPAFGLLLILISSAGFGCIPLLAHLAYQDGVNATSLLAQRFLVAITLLLPWVYQRRAQWPDRRQALAYMLMGGVLYTLQAQSYFTALQHASSGLVALLLYVYPILVVLFSAMLRWEPLSWQRGLLLIPAFGGTLLMLSGPVQGSTLGVALGLASALCYAVYILCGSRLRGDALLSGWLILCGAAISNTLLATLQGWQWPSHASGWLGILGLAVFGTVLAITLFLAGMARAGAGPSAIVSTFEPVVTIALGYLLLGERLQPMQWLGGALVLLAVVLLARQTMSAKALAND